MQATAVLYCTSSINIHGLPFVRSLYVQGVGEQRWRDCREKERTREKERGGEVKKVEMRV